MRNLTLTLLMFALAFAGGCSLFPKEQYRFQEGDVLADGTRPLVGSAAYVGADGKATDKPTNPVTGEPHDPLDVNDIKKGEQIIESAKKGTDWLPYGIGGVVGAIVAALGGMTINAAKKDNAKKLKDAGISKSPTPPPVGPAT